MLLKRGTDIIIYFFFSLIWRIRTQSPDLVMSFSRQTNSILYVEYVNVFSFIPQYCPQPVPVEVAEVCLCPPWAADETVCVHLTNTYWIILIKLPQELSLSVQLSTTLCFAVVPNNIGLKVFFSSPSGLSSKSSSSSSDPTEYSDWLSERSSCHSEPHIKEKQYIAFASIGGHLRAPWHCRLLQTTTCTHRTTSERWLLYSAIVFQTATAVDLW